VNYLLRSWYFAFVGGTISLVLGAVMVTSALTKPTGGGLGDSDWNSRIINV